MHRSPPALRSLSHVLGLALLLGPFSAAASPGEAPPPPSERIRQVVAAGERGPEALPEIRAALADPDAGVRAAAAQTVWSVGGAGELEHLVPLIEDESESVVLAAVSGMIGLDDPRVVPHVLRCLAECRESVRAQLSAVIGDRRDDRFVEGLGGLLASENPGLRRTALQALQAVGDPRAFPYFMTATSDGDVRVAKVAIGALARLGDARATPRIVALCGSDDEDIRAEAASALPAVAPAAEHRELLVKLLQDPAPRVPAGLLRALRDHVSPGAMPVLEKAATLPDPRLRRSVAMALDGAEGDLGSDLLVRLTGDEDEFVRAAAVQSIGERGLASRAYDLAARVTDPSPTVRTTLATAFGALGGEPATVALGRLARDPDAGVRSAAADAAARLPAEGALPILTALLEDADAGVRVVTVRSLGRVADPRALDSLRAAVSDREIQVRVAALVEIARLGDRDSLEVVRKALGDPAEPVRNAARNAMSALREP